MMQQLEDFPDHILAIHASRNITKQDYDEVLIPAANKALESHSTLRIYYEIDASFTDMDAGAMWEDFVYGRGASEPLGTHRRRHR